MRVALLAAAVASALAMTVAEGVRAQPAGSCLLPDGRWCWPVEPTRYGRPCLCRTSRGLERGIAQ